MEALTSFIQITRPSGPAMFPQIMISTVISLPQWFTPHSRYGEKCVIMCASIGTMSAQHDETRRTLPNSGGLRKEQRASTDLR
jgi:hypothetical protein